MEGSRHETLRRKEGVERGGSSDMGRRTGQLDRAHPSSLQHAKTFPLPGPDAPTAGRDIGTLPNLTRDLALDSRQVKCHCARGLPTVPQGLGQFRLIVRGAIV